MAIQNRRGLKKDFDPTKMLPGEWAVTIDPETENQMVYMCFAPGVVKRMGTYEDFKEQLDEAAVDREQIQANKTDITNLEKLAITPSVTGTQIVAKDSAEWPVQALTVYGRTEQDKTTGKNIVNCMDNKLATFTAGEGSLTGRAWAGVVFDNAWVQKNLKPSTTYYGSMSITMIKTVTDKTAAELSKYMLIYRSSTSSAGAYSHIILGLYNSAMTNGECVNVQNSFTTPDDLTDLVILGYTERYTDDDGTGTYSSTVTFSDIMLSEAEMPYEPYTGGKPSPSPDYPQEIVSAGQMLATGAQLFEAGMATLGGAIDKSSETIQYYGNNWAYTDYIPVKENTSYTVSWFDNYEKTGYAFYNASKERISGQACTKDFVTPAGAAYVRLTIFTVGHDISQFMFAETAKYPRTYEPYTGGVPAVITRGIDLGVGGKNLFDVSQMQSNSKLIVNSDGSLTAKGYASSTNKKLEQLCPGLMIGCTYTMSMKTTGLNSICLYNDSATVAANMWKNGGSKVITQDMLDAEVLLYCKRDSGGNNSDATISDIQIEPGSTVTSYEPYRPIQTATIASANGLPGIPVSSGGNYTDESGQQWVCDTIEYRDGQAVYVKRVWTKTFDGSEIWRTYLSTSFEGFITDNVLPEVMNRREGFCNLLAIDRQVIAVEGIWIGVQNNIIYVHNSQFYDATLSDKGVANWKAYLADHPMTVMTYLTTPTETPLTDTEAAQLATLHTYKPTTTVTNDAGVGMDMTYIADTKTYIDNKFAELQTALATTNAQLI